MVLNACDSAKVSSSESSNLAKIFNLHGIDNVVAMSYGFMSHSATIFMNEFYTCFLLKRYDLQRAVFTARLRLRTDSNRLARHATRVEVEDSFVPVLYQTHSSPVFWIEESALVPDTIELSNLDTIPSASEGLQNTQRTGPTILGRDMDMLLLESILEDFKVVSLVGGPGVGKTTFINYLQDWWASSRFAEKIFYFDCQKESDLWTNSAIYEKIANEIPIKPHPHIDRKATIHRAHYIIFLDNLEPHLAQNRSLPGDLSSAQERSFYAFVKEFEKPGKDYHCKLVISSRKAPDMDGQIKLQEVILKPVSIVEAMACAQDILASHDVSLDQGEEASQQLEELLLFHDNNFLFLNIFLPTLKDGTNKLYGFLSTLQIGLPTGVSESLDLNLTSAFKFAPGHSDDQPNVTIAKPNIISSFAYWVMELQDDFPRRYWMLMSLAPFQRRIDLNPKVLLVVLHIRGFISDSNFEALESEIQNTTLLRYYHQEAVEKFFTANPDWIPDWSMMVAQLEAHGLVQLHIHSNPRRAMYMELHPLLPYMIRHEIMYRPSGDGQSVLDQTYTIFREYHELRSRSLLLINPQIDIIFETMMKERINLHNAIALNLQHPQFGCELMMTLSTLINDNLLAATQTEQRAAIEVATKVLARFQQLAASEHGYCTTPNIELSNALLEQTLAVAIYRGRIFALLRDDMEAISNAELALQIFEAAVTQFLPGDNALALKLGLDCVAVQRDFSPERVKSLLEVEPPEQATFVYKAEMESMKQGLQINYMRFQMACGAFNDMKRDVERLKNYPENATLAAVRAAPGVKENTGNLLSLGPKLIQTMSGFNPKDDAAMRALSEELSGLSSDLAQWNPEVRFELERLHGLTHGTAENLNQRRDKMQKAATAAKLGRNHYQEYICHTTLFDLAFEGEDHEAAVLHHQRLLELEQQPQSYKIDETQDSLRRENAIRDFKIGKLLHDAASDVEDPTARNMQYMQSAHHLDLCEDFLRTTPGEVKRLYIFLIMRSVQERDLGKGDDAATVLIFEAVALAYKDPPFIDSPFMDSPFLESPFSHGRFIPCLVSKWLGTAHPEELEVGLGKLVGWTSKKVKHFIEQCALHVHDREKAMVINTKVVNPLFEEAEFVLLAPNRSVRNLRFWERNVAEDTWCVSAPPDVEGNELCQICQVVDRNT